MVGTSIENGSLNTNRHSSHFLKEMTTVGLFSLPLCCTKIRLIHTSYGDSYNFRLRCSKLFTVNKVDKYSPCAISFTYLLLQMFNERINDFIEIYILKIWLTCWYHLLLPRLFFVIFRCSTYKRKYEKIRGVQITRATVGARIFDASDRQRRERNSYSRPFTLNVVDKWS